MASKNQEKAVLVAHPYSYNPPVPMASHVYRIALTAAAVSTQVPVEIRGKFIRIKVQGIGTGKVQYNFTNVAATLVYNQTTTFTPADTNIGWTLYDNEVVDARIPQVATFFNYVGSPGLTGFLELSFSETAN